MIVLIGFFAACRSNNMIACISTDKDTAMVGDTIIFNDCSGYDGDTEAATLWFGDGNKTIILNREPIKHVYSSPGKYEALISIGGPEQGSRFSDTIVIN